MEDDKLDPQSDAAPSGAGAAGGSPAAAPDGSGGSAYVTQADLERFGQAIVSQIAGALRAHAASAAPAASPVGGGSAGGGPADDWETQFHNRTVDAATQRMMEVNKPILADRIAEHVAAQYGPDVKREIAMELQRLPGSVVAALTQSPDDLKKLARMARGIAAERQDGQAPRSGGSGTVGAATSDEMRMADKFWSDYRDVPGFSKDDAKRMAKERSGSAS